MERSKKSVDMVEVERNFDTGEGEGLADTVFRGTAYVDFKTHLEMRLQAVTECP